MLKKQNPFSETGGASSIIALQEDMGIGIVGDTQEEITPFQRQVFEAEKRRQAEEKEKRMEKAKGGSGRKRNSAPNAGGPTSSRSETVRYESEGERDDDTLDVID